MKIVVWVERVVAYSRAAFIGLGCLSLLLVSSPGIVSAASTPSNPGASGLSISPLRNEMTLSPGKAENIKLTLKNITGGPIIAKPTVLDFTSDGSTGNPRIITDPNYNDPSSIKSFLVGVGNIKLATGQQTIVDIPVQVPAGTPPGAYFGLLEYQSIPQQGSNESTGVSKVALSAGVSSLIFITVPGNVTERMELNSISVYGDPGGTQSGIFFTKPPSQAGVTLINMANAFEKPFGTVIVQNMSGKQVMSYQLNSSVTRGLVLPFSSRTFKNKLSGINSIGRYTIIANVSYGSGSAILVGKKSFWYIPLWLWIIIILVLLALVGAATFATIRYRRASNSKFKRS